MSAATTQVLPAGAGWAVVCGLGFLFALFIIGLSFIQQRYTSLSIKDTDEFASASRSVKPGLVASGIVSAWTWSSTLLQSSAMAYKVGVSGGYYYGAGATIQILLCSIMACRIKLNAPFASTFLEVLRVRWGKATHLTFLAFALVTNLLVSSQLVVGGSAVASTLTGIPTLAAIWLIPLSVACYVLVGGMRATLLADYTHTVGLLVIILFFFFKVWIASDQIDGFGGMVARLTASASIDGNAAGSPLTFRSTDGLVFAVINICGNLGTVFADQSYHQRSIASNPSTAARAFLLGGSAWFAIPFLFSMTMGLAARSLMGNDPAMPLLSSADVSAGLAAPAAAVAIAGKGGAVAMLILLFLAVTSASSAQQVAVAPDLRPHASGREVFFVTHAAVVLWAVVMGVFGTVFFYADISLGWLYLCMGILISPAVVPIFCGLTWRRTSRAACMVGMVGGVSLGVVAWLATARALYGPLSVTTTGMDYPTLAGNLVSLCTSGIVTVVGTLLWPETEDHFVRTRAINAPADVLDRLKAHASLPGSTLAPSSSAASTSSMEKADLEQPGSPGGKATHATTTLGDDGVDYVKAAGLDAAELKRTLRLTTWVSVAASVLLCVVIPACLASRRVWNVTGLQAYIWLGFVWLCWTAVAVGLLPVWESRHELAAILRGIAGDLTGRRRKA
ncbi:uncharacterized protein PFL1_03785 [Pseudozyma flocculosa PF-1]|uniref:Urea transporter n=1 Tax=Pseudozyma flocculosa PF-1 TaxID=1277687 RepID=A0A061H6E7_9BASI|nr:uncharacterized protein PFL1_03785 [Pseudozyma flocculosa PF-1]EPQ28482.1 hypothetical protein PFL1_03785 [Pseudozyma flocculosa PF-1]